MTAFLTVDYTPDDGIAWITLSRPDVHNAINLQMRDDLWQALDVAESDPEIGVVIFTGAGEAAFSAGADVSEFGSTPSLVAARDARHDRDLWWRLECFPKPMIAAIRGWALGAGLELALYCDLRLATPDSTFGLPEVSLGYIPAAGGTQTLPRTVGRGAALDLALSGRRVGADEALQLGLVSRVVPGDRLETEARARARSLLITSPPALRYAREAIRLGSDAGLEAGLALERRLATGLLGVSARAARVPAEEAKATE